jgi:CBS domain-containing protein
MNVLALCDPEAAAVPIEANVADAISKMLDFHVGAVAVIDSKRRVAGIFTERDVLRKFSLSGRNPAQTPVRELMTTPVELATSQTGPGEALLTMVERHFRHFP